MFPSRPRPGENEDDLLRAQDQFHGRKRSKFAESRAHKEPVAETVSPSSEGNAILLQPRILERDVSGIPIGGASSLPMPGTNEPFPSPFKLSAASFNVERKRGQSIFAQTLKKESLSSNKQHCPPIPPVPFVEYPTKRRDFGEHSVLLRDSKVFDDKVCQGIHDENVTKLSSMSEEDIILERKKILESIDPKILDFLKSRSVQKSTEVSSQAEDNVETEAKKENDHLEEEKMKWMTDISKVEGSQNPLGLPARFDFKGEIMEGSKDDDFKSGLHHHGEEPHRAGYTLDELLILCRSTFPQQKILALETLGAVIRNYKNGLFDGVFEVNILDSLFKTGILEILRMGMDEKSENIIFPSAQTLSEFLYNDLDEVALDLTFNNYLGHIQPSLPTDVSTKGSKSHAEYEDEKKELKDAEIIQLDVIYALLRMDILDRIAYIITHLNPGIGVSLACLKILIRMARHSQVSARNILHHPKILKQIAKSFLPSMMKNVSDNRGNPVHLALKLVRIIISWDKNYAVFICSTQKNLGEALLSYIAYDPTSTFGSTDGNSIPTLEALSLVLESFRFWKILLHYKLGTEYYLDFYPILLRQLLYYENKIDILDKSSNKKYIYDHGSALIQILESTVLNLGYSKHLDWSHFKEMFSLLENCVKKWSYQIRSLDWTNTLSSSKVAISNLLASSIRALVNYYWKYSEQKECQLVNLLEQHVRKFNSDVLAPFFSSHLFQDILSSSFKCSALNVTSEFEVKSGKNRDPKNLPSFGSVVYRGSVVPSIGEGSPYNLLVSVFYSYLLCQELDKSLQPPKTLSTALKSIESSLEQFLEKSKSATTLLNSNWFTRIEAYFWTYLTLVLCRFKSQLPHLLSLGHLSLSFLHSWDEELAIELVNKVIFNSEYLVNESLTIEKLKRLQLNSDNVDQASILRDLQSLYTKYLFPSKTSLERSKMLFRSEDLPNLTVSNAGELLLPWDWKFLPLLALHNSRDVSDSPATDKEISEVRMCLTWINIMDNDTTNDPFPSVTFTRLCTLFTAAPDLFLDYEIRESGQNLFKKLLMNWKCLDLSKDIPGSDNFFTFYSELLKQFSAVSYGDSLFAEFVTLPLAMKFSSKYRFAFWSDHSDDLRIVNLKDHSLPLKEFLYPLESDTQMVKVYFASLIEGRVTKNRNPFLYSIALHHVRSASIEESILQEFKTKITSDHPLYGELFM